VKTAHVHTATCNFAHWLTRHGSPTIYRCFALPQLLYRWRHQSGIFWIYPRIHTHTHTHTNTHNRNVNKKCFFCIVFQSTTCVTHPCRLQAKRCWVTNMAAVKWRQWACTNIPTAFIILHAAQQIFQFLQYSLAQHRQKQWRQVASTVKERRLYVTLTNKWSSAISQANI
jgi:hypothetical protein